MNYLKLILLSFSAFFICFSLAFGMDQNFNVDGYHIKVFVGAGGSGVEAHGQISGGESCESLELDLDCISKRGEKANILAIVRKAGGAGTRLFRASKSALNTTDEWTAKKGDVRSIYIFELSLCLDIQNGIPKEKGGRTTVSI